MCQRCLKTKPDRCHHCSQCNRCVLKMDHHCPWVANCIGFFNYKYFMNMLVYTTATCWFVLATSWQVFSHVLGERGESVDYRVAYYVVTSYLLAGTLGFVITGFLAFHLWLISKQYTTIEFCEKRSDNEAAFRTSPYTRGTLGNLRGVFGDNPILWLVPFCKIHFRFSSLFLCVVANTRGEGLLFEVREDLKAQVMHKTQ